jgi:hypothetical protein
VDQYDRAFPLASVTWVSAVPGVATVSDVGLITGVAPGTTTITAASGGVAASATLTITNFAVPARALVVLPAQSSLTVGDSLPLSAVFVTDAGVTSPATGVSWVSSLPAIATVTPDGVVRAVKPGTANIVARAEGLEGTMAVAVSAPIDASMVVHLATPFDGQVVADTLHVVATVTTWQHIASADLRIDNNDVLEMKAVKLGAMGGVDGWEIFVSLVNSIPIGFHRLIVTAHGDNGSITADTITVDREVPQTGGQLPPGGRKLVAPARPPGVVPPGSDSAGDPAGNSAGGSSAAASAATRAPARRIPRSGGTARVRASGRAWR